MAAVATPFVLLLAVGAYFIVRLNERIADVPKMLTREQLLTLAERNRSAPARSSFGTTLTSAPDYCVAASARSTRASTSGCRCLAWA